MTDADSVRHQGPLRLTLHPAAARFLSKISAPIKLGGATEFAI
jgi:hypothetical protein